MRVLCVCRSGHVRSVTLARLLDKRGHVTLTLGIDNIDKTMILSMLEPNQKIVESLCDWAEVIFCQKDAEQTLLSFINDQQARKIDLRFDVGPDDWKIPMDPGLLRIMREKVEADPQWKHRAT